ncbi:MAG: galactose mutarotase [Verrucomicrobiales bacterium]|nr:galactose mutarotase [Verrucomicrobiales bacterium]MCB1227977.1 galactose mutarotase [Verrucomicrobiales bacterium]
MPDGREVRLFTLRNAKGMEARITEYGGILVSLTAPDREGKMADVVLGFDRLEDYQTRNPFFGAITGRYANRIRGARFTLDGQSHELEANSGKNQIHGGRQGFDKQLWSGRPIASSRGPAVAMDHVSPAGAGGFPGALRVTVTYTLTDSGALEIDYQASTDAPTHVNLTNHTYFNLAGSGSVLDQELMVNADAILETDDQLIPIGSIRPIAGTPMDFRSSHALGSRIDQADPALRQGKGYDHCYVLPGVGLREVAQLYDPASGRLMTVRTTEPGVQVYTANNLKSMTGKGGQSYGPRSAVCLETQHYPDSPNQPSFPSTVLRPGDRYQSTTVFAFSTR